MQIQSTRLGKVGEAGQTPASQGVSSGKTSKSARSQSRERQPDLNRFERWVLIGTTQQRISSAQSSEQALGVAWNELKRLEPQLGRQQSKALELNGRLQQLEEKISGDNRPLTRELQPRLLQGSAPQLAHYRLDKIDLLTPRSESERILLSFPVSGSSVEVQFPANASEEEVLRRLNTALQGEKIQVKRDGKGSLEFSLPEELRRKLDEPVLLRGEGIRMPAGNPIPVRLSQREGVLSRIEDGLARGELRQEQKRIHQLLGEIEQSVRKLKQYRQNVLSQLEKVRARTQVTTSQDVEQLQSRLSETLNSGGFAGAMSGLLAQANVSRQTVVALLT